MSKPLPVDHPLVVAVAKQLSVAIRMDGLRGQQLRDCNYEFGPAVLEILAELVGAAHNPGRIQHEIDMIDAMIDPAPSAEVLKLQGEIKQLLGIIDRGREALRP